MKSEKQSCPYRDRAQVSSKATLYAVGLNHRLPEASAGPNGRA